MSVIVAYGHDRLISFWANPGLFTVRAIVVNVISEVWMFCGTEV